MKILHIYKSYYPFSIGGIEKYIHSLSTSLQHVGIECSVLTTGPHERNINKVDGHKVYYFPSNLNFASCPISISLLKEFPRIVQQYDILHYHFPWPFGDLTSFLIPSKKPIVISYHSDIVRQKYLKFFYQPLMYLFLNKAEVIIASSQNYLQSSPVLKKYSHKTTVIPYGLERDQFPKPTAETVDCWKKRLGENFFLFVGVLRYYKGLDFLIEAVKNTSIPLVIAGSGPEEDRLAKIKETHQIQNVKFVGHISEQDKAALYHLCRATVAPSHLRAEAFCISLLESLIYEKPAISTELGTGTSFVNEHNITGLVVPPANPMALKQAMELLLKDNDLYERLRKNTLIHYHKYFCAEAMRDQHLCIYRKLCTN